VSRTDTKEIRKRMKEELGYNARQVSVKQPHYSSIEFTIRDATVDEQAVEEFSNRFQNYQTDQGTGEILQGGNTFTFVRYSDELRQALSQAALPAVEKTLSEIEGNRMVEIPGTEFLLSTQGHEILLWKKHQPMKECAVFSPEAMAFEIAKRDQSAFPVTMSSRKSVEIER
jgi:hypothetical protein